MRPLKQFILSLVCFLVAVLLIVVTNLPKAVASSDYGVKLTSELHLGGIGDTGTPGTCYEYDPNVALNWSNIMQPSNTSNPLSYQNTWNYKSNYNQAQTKLTSFVTRFWNSFNSTEGTGWAVSQASMSDSYYNTTQPEFDSFHKMIRIWAFDPDTTFTLTNDKLVSSKPVYYTDYFYNPNVFCRWQAWQTNAYTYSLSFLHNKFLFLNAQNVTYPVDYVGDPIPSTYTPPNARYVAMGDSFSSGEGNPSFEYGSDTSSNKCHRSPQAYPRLLQNDPSLDLGPTAFVACSGATTDNVLYGGTGKGAWGESPQVDALSEDTEIVTITIGGNDVGFKEFAEKCVSPLNPPLEDVCDEYTDIYDEVIGSIETSLPAKLEDVYSKLLDEAPNAEIFVVGYPEIAPYKDIGDPFDQDCGGLYDQWPNTWGDARAAYEVVTLLNDAIEDTVDTVAYEESSTRLHYVDVTSGAFVGHDTCSSDSYFNGIDVFNPQYSIHPNSNGQLAYKEDIASEVSH